MLVRLCSFLLSSCASSPFNPGISLNGSRLQISILLGMCIGASVSSDIKMGK